MNKFNWIAVEIFKGIAFHKKEGGANSDQIVKFVNWQQRTSINETELNQGISSLLDRNIITKEGEIYKITKHLESKIPQTAKKQFSFSKKAWEALFAELEKSA